MAPELILGPLLRYAGGTDATVWIETDAARAGGGLGPPAAPPGPRRRSAGGTEAPVWIETDAACEVEVLGHTARTFEIEGHYYALVRITDLEPGETYEYGAALDGQQVSAR